MSASHSAGSTLPPHPSLLRPAQGEASSSSSSPSWWSLRPRSDAVSGNGGTDAASPIASAQHSSPSSTTPSPSPPLPFLLSPSPSPSPSPTSPQPPAIPIPISPALPLTALTLGFVSGLLSSAQRASLVFMAENAHRRPDTVQGWYFYNKTKNYRVLLAALQGGARAGVRLAAWVGVWAVLERGVAEGRSRVLTQGGGSGAANVAMTTLRDMTWPDGAIAGQVVGGMAAAVYRLSPVRMLLLGTMAGASTGGLRDFKNWLERARELEQQSTGTETGTDATDVTTVAR